MPCGGESRGGSCGTVNVMSCTMLCDECGMCNNEWSYAITQAQKPCSFCSNATVSQSVLSINVKPCCAPLQLICTVRRGTGLAQIPHTHTYISIPTHIHRRTYVRSHTLIHMTHTYVHTQIHIPTHIHMHIHSHTSPHIQTLTLTHTKASHTSNARDPDTQNTLARHQKHLPVFD